MVSARSSFFAVSAAWLWWWLHGGGAGGAHCAVGAVGAVGAGGAGGAGGADGAGGDLVIDLGPSHAPVRLLAFDTLEQYWKGERLSESHGDNLAALCEVSTGCALWPAARVLVDFLRERPALFVGKRVLELGAGSGAVGLSMRRMGAAAVELTDVEQTLPLLRLNARRNGMATAGNGQEREHDHAGSGGVHVRTLEWNAPLPAWLQRAPPQLVVGSDIVYGVSEKAELPLARTLAHFAALHPAPPAILLAMVDRGDAHAPFRAAVARHCLNVTTELRVPAAAPPTEHGGARNDAYVRRLAPIEGCTPDLLLVAQDPAMETGQGTGV